MTLTLTLPTLMRCHLRPVALFYAPAVLVGCLYSPTHAPFYAGWHTRPTSTPARHLRSFPCPLLSRARCMPWPVRVHALQLTVTAPCSGNHNAPPLLMPSPPARTPGQGVWFLDAPSEERCKPAQHSNLLCNNKPFPVLHALQVRGLSREVERRFAA